MKNAWNGLNTYCLNCFGQFFIPKRPTKKNYICNIYPFSITILFSTHLGHDKYCTPVMYAPFDILDTLCGCVGELVGGGSVINGAYHVLFSEYDTFWPKFFFFFFSIF